MAANGKKMARRVETKIKQIDPDTIVSGTMYDEASGRLFVTVVKGLRKTTISLLAHDLEADPSTRVDQAIKDSLKQLPLMPIG